MTTSREFAIEVTRKLQQAGYTALWAGGCVRDQLIGKTPKDYDIATNATPDQVRELFGKKRTLAIGASFGVITVLGPKSADPIEVATFRKDSGYSDGRRPDAIEFTDAREDAIRRDFTINGMFFDPIADQVIDYVGGQEDLKRQVIRAIGNPHERIDEDKLRMLRAVRFASTFNFELESETLAAVQQHASQIKGVSGERIGAELRRMLGGPARMVAANLLKQSKLLFEILTGSGLFQEDSSLWQSVQKGLQRLECNSFACATAILVGPLNQPAIVDQLFNDWKLSNPEKKTIGWVLKYKATLSQANELAWSVVQPLLVDDDATNALHVLAAEQGETPAVSFCRERLDWPAEKLDPAPLMTGKRMKELGISPGKMYGQIIKQVRSDQLDGKIKNQDEADAFVKQALNIE